MSESTSTSSADEALRTFVLGLVKPLCDQPDEAEVDTDDGEGDIALHVSVAEDDLGRVLGKGGRTVRSLRTIASAAAGRAGRRCTLDIDSTE